MQDEDAKSDQKRHRPGDTFEVSGILNYQLNYYGAYDPNHMLTLRALFMQDTQTSLNLRDKSFLQPLLKIASEKEPTCHEPQGSRKLRPCIDKFALSAPALNLAADNVRARIEALDQVRPT